jgi:hypothetical protein
MQLITLLLVKNSLSSLDFSITCNVTMIWGMVKASTIDSFTRNLMLLWLQINSLARLVMTIFSMVNIIVPTWISATRAIFLLYYLLWIISCSNHISWRYVRCCKPRLHYFIRILDTWLPCVWREILLSRVHCNPFFAAIIVTFALILPKSSVFTSANQLFGELFNSMHAQPTIVLVQKIF